MMYMCLGNASGVINTTCVHSALLQHAVRYNGPMSTLCRYKGVEGPVSTPCH